MDLYIGMESWLPTISQSTTYKNYCVLHFNSFVEKDVLEDLCAKFKCFYSLLFDPIVENVFRNSENVEYLNFWLNKELKNENISSINAPHFYSKLKSDNSSFDSVNALQGKMLVINQEELKNMKTLYDLYNIYNTLKSLEDENNKTCHEYSTECAKIYTTSMENCSNNNFTKYCNALNSFNEKYEKIDSVAMGVCNSKNILPLSNAEIISKEKDLDTEPSGGEQKPSLVDVPPQLLGISLQETPEDLVQKVREELVQEVRGDLMQGVRRDSVPETLGDTKQPLSLSVEGKQNGHYNRVVSGAWLNRRFGRNKNIRKNRNEKVTEEILKYYPDPSRTSTQSDKYSVSYNSLKND
ncbi:hypothetical protein PVIIG_06149 [Plasmodium vivax India VII]|uniref:VIR protein n=1 Tax=Plasmodium vivax India VII TaxID=1077284 RepID=A0A0J9S4M6_PLAVI|nr:hypothetical protein PVIIG_06149 [Plasmodium vivax India VII]